MTTEDILASLRTADFHMGWTLREPGMFYVSSYHVTWEDSLCKVTDLESDRHYGDPFVSFERVARGDDAYGQTSTVERSNYRALRRDFPDFPWVDVSYVNLNGLGCFLADLTEDMCDLLVGLAVEYPVYDEDDMSNLESDEIDESWRDWWSGEVRHELSEPCQDMWDVLGHDRVSDIWWALVSEDAVRAEHQGTEVVWGSVKDAAEVLRPFIIRAYWTVRGGSTLPPAYEWVRLFLERDRMEQTCKKLWAAFMADDTTLHGDLDWRKYLASKGYRTGPDGLVFIGTKGI